MIFDGLIFFNELELLEIRLQELCPVIDRFIIVESPITFSGQPKPLYYAENRARFADYRDKILHVVVDDFPNTDNPWIREDFQRNAISRGLADAAPDDIVLISDADEIPRREAIGDLIGIKDLAMFRQRFYYYWLNCELMNLDCHFTRAARIGYFSKNTPSSFRTRVAQQVVYAGGWHFSYLGGPERIRKKIRAFSHQEFNRPDILEETRIRRAIDNGIDLFDRDMIFRMVPLDETFPHAVTENPSRYREIINIKGLLAPPNWEMDAIALRLGIDKASGKHNYAHFYERLWRHLRGQQLRILEMGVANGNSLRMWKEFFFRSEIVGLDSNETCRNLEEHRIQIVIGNQEDENLARNMVQRYPNGFDIIVDDAGHIWSAQQRSFGLYFPLVRPGGFYVIEDLHTSYWPTYRGDATATTIDFLRERLDDLMLRGESGFADRKVSESEVKRSLNLYEREIECIHFCRGLVVLQKCA